jgi:hypothetical protein
LFIKDGQSIWIERPDTYRMIVAGPGAAREERAFSDEESLQDYQIALSERLTESGWFLWGFDRDRRQGAGRRGAARPDAVDRRAAARR